MVDSKQYKLRVYPGIAINSFRNYNITNAKMFKLCLIAALFALAVASPVPEANPAPKAEPQPDAKPDLLAAYTAPVVAAPALAYTSAYAAAPLAYSNYAYPSAYSVYSPYAASYVVY